MDMKHLPEAQAVLREHGFFDFPRPWIGHTAKACAENGHWADYAGWEKWMNEQAASQCVTPEDANCPCAGCSFNIAYQELAAYEKPMLYGIMSEACEQVALAMGWKRTPWPKLNGTHHQARRET